MDSRRDASHNTIKKMIESLSPALLARLRMLFAADDAGLTPRDYALTLPVMRVLRRWERMLNLSTVGTDAIVIFHQPQLIDSDVIEQFFRTMAISLWATLMCSEKRAGEEDSARWTLKRMKKLALEIEAAGLAASIYSTAETVAHNNAAPELVVAVDDSDSTAVLLITASYSRLLLECSSRALQDDPQYEAHRKLASDLCLPADMQRARSVYPSQPPSARRSSCAFFRVWAPTSTSWPPSSTTCTLPQTMDPTAPMQKKTKKKTQTKRPVPRSSTCRSTP
jgi:hypothetical protein